MIGGETINGIRVLPSRLAVFQEQVRQHIRARHPEAYHLRIEKKWKKRFGMRDVPSIFYVGPGALGLGVAGGTPTMLVHPDVIHQVKKAMAAGLDPAAGLAQRTVLGGKSNG